VLLAKKLTKKFKDNLNTTKYGHVKNEEKKHMNTNLIKRTLFVLFALLLMLSATACGVNDSTPENGGDTNAPADSGEIVIWAWSESEINGLAAKFNEVYPDITVKFVAVESDGYLAKLQNALVTGGELPDVTLQEVGARGAMYALDIWENLEESPYNFDRNVVYPQILPTMTNANGEIVGIERELNPSGMCYKRELTLQYMGTDDPDELGAMISDWDSLIAEGERIATETDGKVKLFAGLWDVDSILYSQYVEPVFEGDTANATAYFEYNLDILLRMTEAGMVGNLQTWAPSWNSSYIDTENYIFYPCAPWSPVWVVKANDPDGEGRWGVTTAPLRGYSWGGTAYGILKDAENKDLAWTFIKWATTTDEGTAACEEVVGAIVSRQANYANGFPANPDDYFAGQSTNLYLMENAAPTMVIRPLSQYDVVLQDVTAYVIEEIYNNPEVTLDELVSIALSEMTNKLPTEMTVK